MLKVRVEQVTLGVLIAACAMMVDCAGCRGYEKCQIPFVVGKVGGIQRRVWSVTW